LAVRAEPEASVGRQSKISAHLAQTTKLLNIVSKDSRKRTLSAIVFPCCRRHGSGS
jgi:hypothetical protein